MDKKQLKRAIDESQVVNTLVAVHKVKRMTSEQIADIMSIEPNYLPPIVERTNSFLEQVAHMVAMKKLQVQCDDPGYAMKHPEEAEAVQNYFTTDALDNSPFTEDLVATSILFYTIGKFCMSTEKFLDEVQTTTVTNQEELIRHIMKTWEEDSKEYLADETQAHRYALRFFRKLLGTNNGVLPQGVTKNDILRHIKFHIYDEDRTK